MQRFPVRRWVLLLAVAVLAAACSKPNGPTTQIRPVLDFEHYTLDNGLEVTLRKDDRVPVASVNLWYSVGPANEVEGRRGFAHLFEHMMLQGSGHRPGDFYSTLQAVGATGVNGSTDLDRTTFLEDVPSDQLELALWAESDRMGFLLDALDLKTLRNQQDVVRNERRQNVDNTPYGPAFEEVYRQLFPPSHPYHHFIYGSHSDIQAAGLDEVKDFFRRYYGPNNATLAVVGNIDIARTREMIDKYFGTIPRGPEVPEVRVEVPRIDEPKRVVVTGPVELPRVYLAWVVDNNFEQDAHGALAARMLGGGKASRLYRDLVYDLQIAQSVTAAQRSLAHGSVFLITATAKPGHAAEELEAAVGAVVARMAEEGPGESELAAAKVSQLAVTVKSLEPTDSVADRLNSYNHFLGSPDYLQRDLDRFQEASAGDVRRFVADNLSPDRRVMVSAVPGERTPVLDPPAPPLPPGDEPVHPAPAEPWRNQVPSATEAPPVVLPVPESFELDNGLTVFVVRESGLPLVTVQLTAHSGSIRDPRDLPGLASFTAEMLNEGAGELSALEIANGVTALGSTLETGSSREASWVIAQALKPNFAKTMEYLKGVVLKPTFPQAEIDRVRRERLAALQQQRAQPLTTAFKIMWREHYGANHPYGHVELGTEQALKAVTREDLVTFHRESFTPSNSALIVTGDLSVSEARSAATEAFGSWEGDHPAGAEIDPPAPGEDRVLLVDRPGAPQTTMVLSQPGLARDDPDWSKLQLVNQVLGDLFSSRLNQTLRERLGVTYGVNSSMTQGTLPGLLYVSMSVDRQQAGASARVVLEELAELKQGGITDAELSEARESVLRSLPALYRTNASAASSIAHLYALNLPQDYFRRLEERLAAVTVADTSAVAARYLNPDEVKVVVVGDRLQAEEQLADLGLGPVALRNPDGLPEN